MVETLDHKTPESLLEKQVFLVNIDAVQVLEIHEKGRVHSFKLDSIAMKTKKNCQCSNGGLTDLFEVKVNRIGKT